jgi:hypothetical protein
MTRHPFDRQYNPPTPVLPVIFSAAAEELRIGPLTAIVDTGADVTLVPTAYLRQIAAPVIAEAYARGVWGERRLVPIYLVDITMGTALCQAFTRWVMTLAMKSSWAGTY